MATSPTQRTIRELKNQGRMCAIVEKWNAFAGPHGVRQDLFGIIDVLALDPQRGVVGVQSCGSNFAQHERKFLEERAEECIEWLQTPGTVLELWGWRKVKLKRGGKAMRWQPRIREFTLDDFLPALAETPEAEERWAGLILQSERAELDRCSDQAGCPADLHLATCPEKGSGC